MSSSLLSRLIQVLGGSIIISIPLFSYANPPLLTISNNAPDFAATFKFNDGDCSSEILGVTGLIKSRAWNMYTNDMLKNLCGDNQSNCKVDIYMTKDNKCDGPIVATIMFDIQKGMISVDSKKMNGFYVYKSGDNAVTIEGGPIQQSTSLTAGTASSTNTTSEMTTNTKPASSTTTTTINTP